MSLKESQSIYVSSSTLNRFAIEQKIRSFADLPTGWYYGEGVPTSQEVVETALMLVRYGRERMFFEYEAFPGANGEILLSIYQGNCNLNLSIEPDTGITATLEMDDEEIYDVEELSLAEAKERIHQYRKSIWMQSDSYTQTLSATDFSDLPAMLSRILEMTQASQLLTAGAFKNRANQFVATSESIIQDGYHLYSGGSTQEYYPIGVD